MSNHSFFSFLSQVGCAVFSDSIILLLLTIAESAYMGAARALPCWDIPNLYSLLLYGSYLLNLFCLSENSLLPSFFLSFSPVPLVVAFEATLCMITSSVVTCLSPPSFPAPSNSRAAPGEGSTAADKSQTAQEKTQARRAQVRKAQIQHRQRKANYVKELELDVTRFRDMISKTENETAQLRNQNESMKLRLKAAGLESPAWKKKKQQQQQTPSEDSLAGQGQGQPPEDRPDQQMTAAPAEMFGSIDIDDLTVTLSVDEKLGTPCFTISSSSSGQSVKSPASTPVSHGQPQPQPQPPLTHPQEQVVINFILSYVPHHPVQSRTLLIRPLQGLSIHAGTTSAGAISTSIPTQNQESPTATRSWRVRTAWAALRSPCTQTALP